MKGDDGYGGSEERDDEARNYGVDERDEAARIGRGMASAHAAWKAGDARERLLAPGWRHKPGFGYVREGMVADTPEEMWGVFNDERRRADPPIYIVQNGQAIVGAFSRLEDARACAAKFDTDPNIWAARHVDRYAAPRDRGDEKAAAVHRRLCTSDVEELARFVAAGDEGLPADRNASGPRRRLLRHLLVRREGSHGTARWYLEDLGRRVAALDELQRGGR